MGRFLIEVPHGEETLACARVVEIFLKTGSHFVTNTDWGCLDGEHKAWILMEFDNKEEARRILPPEFRSKAKIVSLNKFSMEEGDNILRHHRHSLRTRKQGFTVPWKMSDMQEVMLPVVPGFVRYGGPVFSGSYVDLVFPAEHQGASVVRYLLDSTVH